MRIIFMGSPDFAVPTLDALAHAGHELACVYTQPPRPAGRGRSERPTPVEIRARELGLEVRSPGTLRDQAEQLAFARLDAEIAVVAAYGLILPQPILDAPRHGCLNVHASLLPRWRGAAPVNRSIMAGDEVTGVTIMQMEAGLDTGAMLLQREVSLGYKNALDLTNELAELGARMMVEVLSGLERFEPVPQPDTGITYASKISKEEARIDWHRPAPELVRHVQGLSPFPGAWFEHGGERIKLLAATMVEATGAPGEVIDDELTIACGSGAVRPSLVQRAGKSPMPAVELLRGFAIPRGTLLR
ncbi:MAG: methionyl-tRNA formyltransferase [Sphingomonas sp.]|nr:methionyl-tRNA formyltransferase [Sphingomonas sp.]